MPRFFIIYKILMYITVQSCFIIRIYLFAPQAKEGFSLWSHGAAQSTCRSRQNRLRADVQTRTDQERRTPCAIQSHREARGDRVKNQRLWKAGFAVSKGHRPWFLWEDIVDLFE